MVVGHKMLPVMPAVPQLHLVYAWYVRIQTYARTIHRLSGYGVTVRASNARPTKPTSQRCTCLTKWLFSPKTREAFFN